MFNLSDMMGKFQEMQSRLKEVRDGLDNILVEAEAGGGMVRVKANANRQILKIEIDPDIIDKDDPEIMADLITAAVNKALEKAEAEGREALESATKGMMPHIPGLDLGKLGFNQ
ncbi:MAG: YbaB/EbfC family nucleoid-associated protein [Bacteroidetes bacterium]|nr:MAG: YbaB/EbfC family nucleoid-associated protein [Bacteroidota bacterium]